MWALLGVLLSFLGMRVGLAAAPGGAFLKVADGPQIPYTVYPTTGSTLFVSLPRKAGLQQSESRTAERLGRAGVEVGMADLFSARKWGTGDVIAIIETLIAEKPR